MHLVGIMILLLVGITSVAAGDVYSSDSQDTSEWRMTGRDLQRTAYYPGSAPSNFSALTAITKTSLSLSSAQAVVANGSMYIADNARVYRVNATNVSQELDRSGSISTLYITGPTIWNDFVYVTSGGTYYQLNASQLNQTIATRSVGSQSWHNVIIYDGFAYFASTSTSLLFKVNASDISQHIANYSMSACDSNIAIDSNFMYLACGNVVYQRSMDNLSQVTGQYTVGHVVAARGGVTIGGGYAYVGEETNDRVWQLNASNVSQMIASFQGGGDMEAAVAYAHGYVYAGSWDGNLYQLNASNVSQEITRVSLGTVYYAPIVSNDYVFVVAGSGITYQLDAQNISRIIGQVSTGGNFNSPTLASGIFYTHSGTVMYQYGDGSLQPVGSLTTSLVNTTAIHWTWNNPGEALFNESILYLNGTNVQNTTGESYNLSGVDCETTYNLTIHTKDNAGEINTQDITSIVSTSDCPDLTPPGIVTNLEGVAGESNITWNWTSPLDSDFNASILYLDGINVLNTSNTSYTISDLSCATSRTLRINTKDELENINTTNVTSTLVTSSCPSSEEEEESSKSYYLTEKSRYAKSGPVHLDIRLRPYDEKKITILNEQETGVKSVTLKANTYTLGDIFITSLNTKPEDCPIPKKVSTGKIYKILEFNSSIDDANIEEVSIMVAVDEEWIKTHQIQSILAAKCSPESKVLEVTIVKDKNGEFFYAITSDGFSTWVVLGQEPTPRENKDEQLMEGEKISESTTKNSQEEDVSLQQEKEGPLCSWSCKTSIVVFAIGGGLLALGYRNRTYVNHKIRVARIFITFSFDYFLKKNKK